MGQYEFLAVASAERTWRPLTPFHTTWKIVPQVNVHSAGQGSGFGCIVRTAEDTLTYIGVYTSQEAYDDLWKSWAREV